MRRLRPSPQAGRDAREARSAGRPVPRRSEPWVRFRASARLAPERLAPPSLAPAKLACSSSAEIRAFKPRVAEIRFRQVGHFEIGASQGGEAQRGVSQPGEGEIDRPAADRPHPPLSDTQSDAREVRSKRRILRAPLVPRPRAATQRLDMLRGLKPTPARNKVRPQLTRTLLKRRYATIKSGTTQPSL